MKLSILGIRGIPANHGGFETFAEKLALYLTERGWDITVYCQHDGAGSVYEDTWEGIRRVNIPVKQRGALGTIIFDWKSTLHAVAEDSLKLTLGYNTAIFSSLYRLKGRKNIFNMDGIEWKRQKWSLPEKLWLMLNEICGCYLGNHLIADHPHIKAHLKTRVSGEKITVISYGSNAIEPHDNKILESFGVEPGKYVLLVARPEPENSILEAVRAFSKSNIDLKMVVLGKYHPNDVPYHRTVLDAACDKIVFPGAVYEPEIINALRYHCRIYIHGHTVGGTNPSLVEALGAGSPVLAHDNKFNRWVVGEGAAYFKNEDECRDKLTQLCHDDSTLKKMAEMNVTRHRKEYTWTKILGEYETLLYYWQRKIAREKSYGSSKLKQIMQLIRNIG